MRLICGCDYKDEKAQALGEKSVMWTKENTSEENKDFLRNLPHEIAFTAGEYRVKLVHGSPRRLNEYLHADAADDYVIELFTEAGCDVLVCGHTHVPYHRELNGKHLINAGSVGRPKHGDPKATYCILTIDSEIRVEFPKVPYDSDTVAEAILAEGLPEEFARLVMTGKE